MFRNKITAEHILERNFNPYDENTVSSQATKNTVTGTHQHLTLMHPCYLAGPYLCDQPGFRGFVQLGGDRMINFCVHNFISLNLPIWREINSY